MREALRPFCSHLGRPSIDPELIIRMLVIGYVMGIRSERRLCAEVHLNLAYRWFYRLGLEEKVPDHSTFSRYRHGKCHDSNLLRQVFEATVERCLRQDLVSGEGFAVDASLSGMGHLVRLRCLMNLNTCKGQFSALGDSQAP